MHAELRRMWKDAAVAYFNVLSRRLAGGTDENHVNCHKVVGVLAEIRSRYLRNIRPNRYLVSKSLGKDRDQLSL